jgi:hypothetical protein
MSRIKLLRKTIREKGGTVLLFLFWNKSRCGNSSALPGPPPPLITSKILLPSFSARSKNAGFWTK